MIFVWKRLQLAILIFLDIFRDGERLNPSRSVRLSNNKLSFCQEIRTLVKELLVVDFLDLRKLISVYVFKIRCIYVQNLMLAALYQFYICYYLTILRVVKFGEKNSSVICFEEKFTLYQ